MGLFDGMKQGGRDGDDDGDGGGGGEEEAAYVRIQNRSSHLVRITFLDAHGIDESNLDDLSGDIEIDSSLPPPSSEKQQRKPFANGGRYVPLLLGADGGGGGSLFDSGGGGGGVTVEARVPGAQKPTSTLRLIANDGGGAWGWADETIDDDSPIVLVADARRSEEAAEGGGEGRHRHRCFWKVELRVYDNVDTARWMEVLGERVIGDVPFNQIGLPGTHDSGTYAFDRNMGASPDSDLTKTIERYCPPLLGGLADAILDSVFRRLCQCQSKSILDQLRAGVRYLDLRIARHAESGRYYTCHGVYCAEMSAVMGDVRTFLANHPKEIVILDFNHLYEMDGHHVDFLEMVFEILGDVAASPKTTSAASKVSEFWNRKKQAMIIYHASSDVYKDEPFANRVYHNGYIHSPWPEANDTSLLRSKLGGYVQSRYDDKHENRLFVLQGMLTPDVELIKNGLMRGDGLSIRAYAKLASPAVLDWCTEEWMTMTGGGRDDARRDGGGGGRKSGDAAGKKKEEEEEKKRRLLNIVIVDFIEGVSIVPAIIDYNRRLR